VKFLLKAENKSEIKARKIKQSRYSICGKRDGMRERRKKEE
jgi:hypothetical protein